MQTPTVRVGLALPQYDYSLPRAPLAWEDLKAWAVRADQLGFESVWLADHLLMSVEKYGGPAQHYEGFEPLTALGALAAITERSRLGVLVACAQLRSPSILAKQVATTDVISAGRVELGLGAGWFEPDFEMSGVRFERPGVRLSQLEDTLRVLDRDLRGHGAPLNPPPLQRPRPPLHVGGRGDRLLEVVARSADGWNTVWTLEQEVYRDRLSSLERACEKADRDPATVERSVGLYTLVGESEADLVRRFQLLAEASPRGVLAGQTLDDWRRGHLVGTVDQVAEQLDSWRTLGVSRVILGLSAVPFAGVDVADLDLAASLIR